MANVSNEELVQKAVVTADALANGGKLNPAQSDKFIDYVIDITGLKNNARVIRFRNEELTIDKIGVGKRVAMPAQEATAPTGRRGVTTSKVSLQPVEIIVPFEIGDTFREHNIQGDNVDDLVVRMMATQLGNDLEELYINADTLGPAGIEQDITGESTDSTTDYIKDTYLAMLDGWLKKSRQGNVVDMGGTNIGANVFSRMLNAMPQKFKRNRSNLRFICATDLEQLYREKVSTRATGAGDAALNSQNNQTPFGVPLVPFPLFPMKPRIVEHVVLNGTTPVKLLHGPVSNAVVLPSTLAAVATSAYDVGVDYSLDAATGTITRIGTGAISSGATVKVTYDANPQLMLTHMDNFIIGIGRDIRIEKDRDIYKRVNQYAITVKVSVQFEETSAIVLGRNLGTGV